MVFSSIIFLVYFLPFFLLLYFIVDKKYKNAFLLVASILFYSWGAPRFIFVILGTTMADFYLVKLMDASAGERKRKLLLITSLSINVGLLFYFKYCNFFIEQINSVITLCGGKELKLLDVVLPIGISFYTFETLTYVIDVYRKVHKPLSNFWQYQLYIILFPKLIAGPIIRYHEIADQIPSREETSEKRLAGFYRFGIGLAKKVMIANVLAVKADEVFGMPAESLNASIAWIGALAYTFQIYFDFSGYSDMAIGIGKMMGFDFPENFNSPYCSGSITEFWRRWHMTLGNWMRNYLYIPLGGNRGSKARTYFNLWIVFIASGFWHGASWTFILWGVYHGTFLALERMFLSEFFDKIGKAFATLITFVLILIGWVLFRADSVSQALSLYKNMFSLNFALPEFFIDGRFAFYLCLAAFFSFFALAKPGERLQTKVFSGSYNNVQLAGMAVLVVILYAFSMASISSGEVNPFIYFRF